MYTFTFRIGTDKETFEENHSEITIQAPGYYDEATITKTDDLFPWLKILSRFWPFPIVPPCGVAFSFDDTFCPFDLYYAVKNSDCYFELETDYSGDLSKWPPLGEDEEDDDDIIDEETGEIFHIPRFRKKYGIFY